MEKVKNLKTIICSCTFCVLTALICLIVYAVYPQALNEFLTFLGAGAISALLTLILWISINTILIAVYKKGLIRENEEILNLPHL